MKRLDEYIIQKETKCTLNHYDENGKLCSIVVEEEEVYEVNESPLTVIKKSIQYYGGSLNGAILSAKEALGNISMPPVMISGSKGIYWFPSKSIAHEDCAWFSVDHIKDYEPIENRMLRLSFYTGPSVTIDSTYHRFDKKVNRAHKFKNIMERRAHGKRLYLHISTKPFSIIRDGARNHYRIARKRK